MTAHSASTKDNFTRVLAIVAIIYIPVALLSTAGMSVIMPSASTANGAFPIIGIVVYIIGILIAWVGQQLSQAALFLCVGGAYLGESVSMRGSLSIRASNDLAACWRLHPGDSCRRIRHAAFCCPGRHLVADVRTYRALHGPGGADDPGRATAGEFEGNQQTRFLDQCHIDVSENGSTRNVRTPNRLNPH